MTATTKTLAEAKVLDGKAFTFYHSNINIAAGASENVVICVGDEPILMHNLFVQSDSEILTWQPFFGPTFTPGSGIVLPEVKRNSNAATSSLIDVEINPTITDPGLPIFPLPFDMIGDVKAGNRSFIDKQLMTDPFTFAKNNTYNIQLVNTDAQTRKINIIIGIWRF